MHTMGKRSTREYLLRIRDDYLGEWDRKKRGRLLDEACRVTGLERKYVNKILLGHRDYRARKGRGKGHTPAAETLLVQAWEGAGGPCAKYLKSAIGKVLDDLGELQNVRRENLPVPDGSSTFPSLAVRQWDAKAKGFRGGHPVHRGGRKRQNMETAAESHSSPPSSGLFSDRAAGFVRLPSLLFLVALLAVLLYFCRYTFIRPPAPTPAGFDTVRWGMTQGEVRNAAALLSPVKATASVLAYDTAVLGRPCRVAYAFHNERLAAARLQFSAPGVASLPGLTRQQVVQGYQWLKAELSARYDSIVSTNGYPRESRNTRARPEVREYEVRLEEARRRLSERTEQLQRKYARLHRRDIEAVVERELATERRLVQDLEQWLRDTRAMEENDPVVSRLETMWALATWDGRAMDLALVADFTTSPPSLEIRYKVLSNRRPATVAGEI